MDEFFTIENNITTSINEKKSKFIANLYYVSNQDEAEKIIKDTKKKYHDARHNCYAYRVIENHAIIEKFSDDGEPSGTAGAPMLDIIKLNKLCNILIIVTRYFGGILLGTGGLVRAYSEVTLNSIEISSKTCIINGIEVQIEIDYNNFDFLKYYCKNNDIKIIKTNYCDTIICILELDKNKKDKIIEELVSKNMKIKNIKVLCEKFINKSVKK